MFSNLVKITRDRQRKIDILRVKCELKCVAIDEKSQKRLCQSEIRRKFYDRFKKLELYEKNKQSLIDQKKKLKLYQSYGFHFRRDGKGRHIQNDAQKYEEKLNFQCIEDLLFTDDEIDIEKVLTLHIITVQENFNLLTSDFTPVNNMNRRTSAKTICTRRKYLQMSTDRTVNEDGILVGPTPGSVPTCPLKDSNRNKSDHDILKSSASPREFCATDDEDDLVSSRKSTVFTATTRPSRKVRRCVLEKWFNSFPIVYILDLKNDCVELQEQDNRSLMSNSLKENKINEQVSSPTESKKLLVNIQLIKLLNTVIKSLERGNPSKIDEILKCLQSQNELKQIILSPKIIYFVQMLDTKHFIFRPESYSVIDTVKNPISLQIQPLPSFEKFTYDFKESSVSIHKSEVLPPSSNWKLNLSSSQISSQNKSSRIFDTAESFNLLSTEPRSRSTSIADLLSKRLRSNLQRHEKEIRRLKQLKETLSDEALLNEKQIKNIPIQNLYLMDDHDEDEARNKIRSSPSYKDVKIVAKPFTIRQAYCYACLNKFRQPNTPQKTATFLPKRTSYMTSPGTAGGGYDYCNNELLFLNNDISYKSTRVVNRILTNHLNNLQNQEYKFFGIQSPPLTDESPVKFTGNMTGAKTIVGGPSVDSLSVMDDGFIYPTQSVYSDQTFFRNSSWPSKVFNDTDLYTLVFKDLSLKKLEEKIAVKETQKRLENFLSEP